MVKLTISQCLRRAKSIKGRIAELKARASASVSYIREKKPKFDFKTTREELSAVKEDLILIETAIAVANATNKIKIGAQEITIAQAIRNLQEIKDEIAWLSSLRLCDETIVEKERNYDDNGKIVIDKVETVYLTDLSEVDRVAQIDKLKKRFEMLNDLVERANHTVETGYEAPTETK